VVDIDVEVPEAYEGSRSPHDLVADGEPHAEHERVGDEHGENGQRGREQHGRQDVLALQQLTEPARAARSRFRHHDRGGNRRRAGARALGQHRLDSLLRHGSARCRRAAYAYAFFSSLSAHFAASSAFMPLIACAYMSTRMYLTSASDALRFGG